jgi:hypothetical protein
MSNRCEEDKKYNTIFKNIYDIMPDIIKLYPSIKIEINRERIEIVAVALTKKD